MNAFDKCLSLQDKSELRSRFGSNWILYFESGHLKLASFGVIHLSFSAENSQKCLEQLRAILHFPHNPEHPFGKETTLAELQYRIKWEEWAANLAKAEGNQGIAKAHAGTKIAYQELAKQKEKL